MNNTINLSINGIPESLKTGTFYRNGGNNIFCIESLDNGCITLQVYDGNGPTGSFRNMGITTFCELLVRKNYTAIRFFKSLKTGNWMERRDYLTNRILSAERYLIKH